MEAEKDKLPTLIPEKWLIDIIDSRLNNVIHKEHCWWSHKDKNFTNGMILIHRTHRNFSLERMVPYIDNDGNDGIISDI